MSAIDFLQTMLDSGLSLADAMIAARAFEAAQNAPIEARRRKDRERKRSTPSVESVETAESVEMTETPSPFLPSPPDPPTPPTPTRENKSPARKGRPFAKPEKPEPDLTERVWQAASKTSRDRSGRPALGKAVLAAIRAGATDAALLASVRDHCRAQGEYAKGVHLVVAGEHWRDHLGQPAPTADDGPIDAAVTARRLRQYRDTGTWEPAWGPKPEAPANDSNREQAA